MATSGSWLEGKESLQVCWSWIGGKGVLGRVYKGGRELGAGTSFLDLSLFGALSASASVEKTQCGICLLLLLSISICSAEISSVFLLGDSLLDFGNNNNIPTTTAKATFPPYGKDYPSGIPTGRFANQYLIPDFIISYLGLPSPQPYLSPLRNESQGVNFGSAGCGLYNTTGYIFVTGFPSPLYPRPMPLQVQNFIEVKNILISQLGSRAARQVLNKALFYITFGSNDIGSNYFLPNSTLQSQYTITEFIDVLIQIYETQLVILHHEGARKFAIVSLFPLGCGPKNLFLIEGNVPEPGKCFEVFNQAAKLFNCKLSFLVSKLAKRFKDSKFLYANSYDIPLDIVQNPASYGFTVPNVGCCNFIGPGPGNNHANPVCLPDSPTCANSSAYVYWDQVHPTSRAYEIVANLFWNGSTSNIYPLNIKQLSTI